MVSTHSQYSTVEIMRKMAEPELAQRLTFLHKGELRPHISTKELREVPSEKRHELHKMAVTIAVRWYSNPLMAPPTLLAGANKDYPSKEEWDILAFQVKMLELGWVETCLFTYSLWKTLTILHGAPEGY